MKFSFIRLTQGSLKSDWPQAVFLLLIALLLNSVLIGFIEFSGSEIPSIELSVFLSPDNTLALPGIANSADFLLLFCVGILLALALPVLTPISASVLVAICTAPFLYTGIFLPYQDSEIPMDFKLLLILMLFGLNVLISYFIETHRKQKLIGVFGKFVPPPDCE